MPTSDTIDYLDASIQAYIRLASARKQVKKAARLLLSTGEYDEASWLSFETIDKPDKALKAAWLHVQAQMYVEFGVMGLPDSCNRDGKRGQTLVGATRGQVWQTPGVDSFRSRGGDRRDEMGLDQQARNWAMPAAANYRSGEVTAETHNRNSRPLQEQACLFSHPAPVIPGGRQSSGSDPISLPQLNPAFDCWLMGLPPWWTNIGVTSCVASEIRSYLSAQRWHLSRLLGGLDC